MSDLTCWLDKSLRHVLDRGIYVLKLMYIPDIILIKLNLLMMST